MKPLVLIAMATLLAGEAAAQRHKVGEINTETEEGKILQAIGTEEDAARKIQLMEEFVGKYGKHEAAGWVWSQLQPAYAKEQKFDKAVEAGEQLLALDPMDIEAAYGNLKASEARKDSAGVAQWATVTSEVARKTVAAPKETDQSDEEYKHAVDFARQVDTYTEYSLYATALAETDPQLVMKLTYTLEERNPESQYLPQLMSKYAWAAREAKTVPEAVNFGERAFGRNQVNEDLLLAMADHHINQPKKDHEKIILYTEKLVEVLGSKPKPEGVGDAEWENKKNTMLGLAHWMAGTTYGSQNKHAQADKSLRTALPLVKDNEHLLAGALFYLGLANYQMGKGRNAQQLADGMNFMKQCAAIKSPFQAQAQKNLTVMRKETGGR